MVYIQCKDRQESKFGYLVARRPNHSSLQVELPKSNVKSRVAAFEKQHPVLQSISKPTWIRATRQRSTTDAVLSWLNATRRPAGSNPATAETATGTLKQANIFSWMRHVSSASARSLTVRFAVCSLDIGLSTSCQEADQIAPMANIEKFTPIQPSLHLNITCSALCLLQSLPGHQPPMHRSLKIPAPLLSQTTRKAVAHLRVGKL